YLGLRRLDTSRRLPTAGKPRSSKFDNEEGNDHEQNTVGTHLQSRPRFPQIHTGQTPPEHLLDVELSMGVATRPRDDGKSLLNYDRGPYRSMAGVRDAGV